MKLFLILIGMVAAGVLGYSLEPELRYQLTGKVVETKNAAPKEAAVVAIPTPVRIDPLSFPADRLPEKIMLKADVQIADAASDLKMTITAGNRVNLIRLDGQNVIISPGASPFEGSVPIGQTDLLEQLAALPEIETPPPAPVIPPAPVVEPTPEPEMPAEPAVVEPAPEPPPEPEPTPAPAPVQVGSIDVVAVMQESIKGGAIKEFTFGQVLDWQASEAVEKIDGESYQTGIASYKAETVFGVKTIQAKALIKGGKVVRWLWPKSGMEIK